jgi:nicotinamide mononucleotide transporter
MTIWDWIALLTGIAGVLLTIIESIWCWPVAIISVVISGVTFYHQRLFGDFSLQIFYLISGCYGWFYWNKKKSHPFKISKMPIKWVFPLILSIVLQSILYYNLLSYFKSDQILFDAILTSCSFTCTFMMTKKWLENWIFWILIDAAYVLLYLIKELPSYALLYGFFSLMAYYGFYAWKKQLTTLSKK